MGLPLEDWVYILTMLYLVIQIGLVSSKAIGQILDKYASEDKDRPGK